MVEWSAKKYQSPTGSPYSILMYGEKEVAVKSYDKITKIKNQTLFKKFLLKYPREIENLSEDLKKNLKISSRITGTQPIKRCKKCDNPMASFRIKEGYKFYCYKCKEGIKN